MNTRLSTGHKTDMTTFNRIWEIDAASPISTIVPEALVENTNHYLAPTFVCLWTQRSGYGDIVSSINTIGWKLGINLKCKMTLAKITDALFQLEDIGIIQGIGYSKVNPSTLFNVHMIWDVPKLMKEKYGCKNYATLYPTDLVAYESVCSSHDLNMISYLNQLVLLRMGMKNPSYATDYYTEPYSVINEDLLETHRAKYAPPVSEMLNAYAEAKVLAWAKFERPLKSKKTSRLIAIVNHGINNAERLQGAMRQSHPKTSSRFVVTHMSY